MVNVITRKANDAREAMAGNNSNIWWPRRVFIEARLKARRK